MIAAISMTETVFKDKLKKCLYSLVCVSSIFYVTAAIFRYGKKLQGRIGGSSEYSDRSYLALHAEDYDDSMDDCALLRPPQEPSGEGDLMS